MELAEQFDELGKEIAPIWTTTMQNIEKLAAFTVLNLKPDVSSCILGWTFLEKTLEDLRVVFELNMRGHVTQAASVAASLFEHSLHASLLFSDRNFIEDFKKRAESKEMILFGADELAKKYEGLGNENIHPTYKWLCKLKHPTFSHLHFDIRAKSRHTKIESVRDQDRARRTMILCFSFGRTLSTIMDAENEAISVRPLPEAAHTDISSALELLYSQSKSLEGELPFDLSKTTYGEKWLSTKNNTDKKA